MARSRPIRLAFLLVPQFSMMSFAAALEPLRAANRLSGQTLYDWVLVSHDGRAVVASSGIPIPVQSSLDAAADPDMLVVCVGIDPMQLDGQSRLRGRLRHLASHGCEIGAISGGTFLLADAGLLDGRRCTVHWEYATLFEDRYPRAQMVHDLFVVDRGVFTCSGGTAGLDLMLHFIREHHGPALAVAVAEQFLHPRIREQRDQQRMALHTRYRITNPKLAEVIRLMEEALADPLALSEIANRVSLSTRQVERLFQRQLGQTPGRFYLELRMARARNLLRETAQPIRSIALECGFGATSHFSSAYKQLNGVSPSDERRRAQSRTPLPASLGLNRDLDSIDTMV